MRDPIGESEEVYREVRDEIEQRVMELIASAARAQTGGQRPQRSGGAAS